MENNQPAKKRGRPRIKNTIAPENGSPYPNMGEVKNIKVEPEKKSFSFPPPSKFPDPIAGNTIINATFSIDRELTHTISCENIHGYVNKHERGVVLAAFGHPLYAHYAHNYCVGLKAVSPDIKVALLYSEGSLNMLEEDQKARFDYLIKVPDYVQNGKNGYDVYKFKIHLDELSPFHKTLFLDCDQQWTGTKTVEQLFDSLDGCSFTCVNRERIETETVGVDSEWAKPSDYFKYYGLKFIYNISSELLYFEKPDVFIEARKVYDSNEMPLSRFGNGLPDEVWFTIAIEKASVMLHQTPYHPTYWRRFANYKEKDDILKEHFALSLGGAMNQPMDQKIYNQLTDAAFYKMNVKRPYYQAQNKSAWLPERRDK